MRAYVLVSMMRRREAPDTLDLLRRTQGVIAARAVAGTSDILALVDGAALDEIDALIDHEIAGLPGVAEARATFHLGG